MRQEKERTYRIMNFKKQALAAGITLSLLMGAPMTMNATEAAAAVQTVASRAAFQKDVADIQAAAQRNIIYVMDMTTKEGHSTYEGMISYEKAPTFHAKGSVKLNVEKDGQTEQTFMPYYFKETRDGLVFYRNYSGNTWEKSVNKDGDMKTLLDGTTEKGILENVAQKAKNVESFVSTDGMHIYMVTLDGDAILDAMPEVDDGINAYVTLANMVLQNADDVQVKVTYDPTRHEIKGIESDLSQTVQSLAPSLAENPLTKQFAELAKDARMIVALSSLPSDIMGDISVPKDIEKSAKEVK